MKIKAKDIVTAAILAVILAAILFGALYLAGRHRLEDRSYAPPVIGTSSQTLGNHYYLNVSGTLMRYDSRTDSVERLCGHSEAVEDCILEKIGRRIQIFNGRVYFNYRTDALGMKYGIAYYDLKSGDVCKLSVELGTEFCIADGYIYYINSTALFRIPADGGEAEKLADCELSERLLMVADGKAFTSNGAFLTSSSFINNVYIYSYDLETLEKAQVFGFRTWSDNAVYCDGKIYIEVNESSYSAIDSSFTFGTSLYSVNTETGEALRLFETEIADFILTEDKIYYIPYKVREVYTPGTSQGVYTVLRSEEIHECDHDGGNDRIVYSNADISFESLHYVGGKLFGLCIGTLPGTEDTTFYAAIDLDNGRIKEIKIPE